MEKTFSEHDENLALRIVGSQYVKRGWGEVQNEGIHKLTVMNKYRSDSSILGYDLTIHQ